jgi:large subunit ribosomal protein L6
MRKLQLVGLASGPGAGRQPNLTWAFAPGGSQDAQGCQGGTPAQTEIVLKGIDKQVVGRSQRVRGYRPPELQRQGVRYVDERVVLKETKKK